MVNWPSLKIEARLLGEGGCRKILQNLWAMHLALLSVPFSTGHLTVQPKLQNLPPAWFSCRWFFLLLISPARRELVTLEGLQIKKIIGKPCTQLMLFHPWLLRRSSKATRNDPWALPGVVKIKPAKYSLIFLKWSLNGLYHNHKIFKTAFPFLI